VTPEPASGAIPPVPAVTIGRRTVTALVVAILVILLAPIARPYLAPGFPQGHDAGAHLTYAVRFDRAVAQGQWPVRWAEGIRDGRGQPVFNYYQVGFYYVVEALRLSGLPLSTAFKVTAVLLWWGGAGFLFLLLRRTGLLPAAIGTLIFALSPYAIIDVFVRAAYPEFAALTFGIGTLWAIDRFLQTGRSRYLPCISVLAALMLTCHLPASMMLAVMCAVHVVGTVSVERDARARLPWVVVACGLGAGLAAFYLVPAIVELPLVKIRQLTTDTTDYHRNFLPVRTWLPEIVLPWITVTTPLEPRVAEMHFEVAVVQWAALAGAVVAMALALVRRRWAPACQIAAWLSVAACALLMTHAFSVRVWDHVPPLAFVQFPWRFLLLLSVAAGVLGALAAAAMRSPGAQLIVLLVVAAGQAWLYEDHLTPLRAWTGEEMNIDDPSWGTTAMGRAVAFDEVSYDPIGTIPGKEVSGRWSTPDWSLASVTPVRLDDAHVTLRTQSERYFTLRLHDRAFPGWRVRVDGARTSMGRTPSTGYIEVLVPPGDHTVDARFENTPIRTAANGVTLLSLVLVPALAWLYHAGIVARWWSRRRGVSPSSRNDATSRVGVQPAS
jgi:hypothetical protein